jgi:hypothetical protein
MTIICFFLVVLSTACAAASVEKSGEIATETWSDTIHITGNTSVNGELTISPGSTVIFDGAYELKINGKGKLICEGTQPHPIRFLSPNGGGSINNLGVAILKFCRFSKLYITSNSSSAVLSPAMTCEDNILIQGGLSTYRSPVMIRRCYVHQTNLSGGRGLNGTSDGSEITDNIFSGGTWVSSDLGGIIRNNIFISAVVPAGGNLNAHTHEHICGIKEGARVERNIFIGKSYAAIMAIGGKNMSNALIRNNTIDMRGGGDAVMFHLTKPPAHDVVFRGNIMMRCQGLNDEQKTPDAIGYLDYNLYVSVKKRYLGIVMSEKKPGDAGFDQHSSAVPDSLTPRDVINDPEFGYPFPYSDDDMLSGAVPFADALAAYRGAYGLRKGSPAIDAGDPQDHADSPDGKIDLGAIEYAPVPAGKPARR